MLLDILFIYCKLNVDVGYRQGMHEIVAPLLWAIERDAVNISEADQDDDELLLSLLDSRYVEHDTFTLFVIIMQSGKSFYELGAENPMVTKQDNDGPVASSPTVSPILDRCRNICESLLPSVDPELAAQLGLLEISPSIFLV